VRSVVLEWVSPANDHSTIAPYSTSGTPEQAVRYHILGLYVRGFISRPALDCLQSKLPAPGCKSGRVLDAGHSRASSAEVKDIGAVPPLLHMPSWHSA
jgi:hypothetical protein